MPVNLAPKEQAAFNLYRVKYGRVPMREKVESAQSLADYSSDAVKDSEAYRLLSQCLDLDCDKELVSLDDIN